MLNQGHLKEQSVHRRQMETISNLLENSQSSKGHICFYFPRHRLGENCSRATWCAYGKCQLAWGTPKILLWMDLWPPQVTLILGDAPYFWICYCLNSFAKPSYRFMEKEAIWLVIKQFHTLCVKFPAALFGFSGTALLPCSLYCCTVPFHLLSNL